MKKHYWITTGLILVSIPVASAVNIKTRNYRNSFVKFSTINLPKSDYEDMFDSIQINQDDKVKGVLESVTYFAKDDNKKEKLSICLNSNSLFGEDYCIIPLLGKEYREGDADKCMFWPDETVPAGSSIIVSVKQPQINRGCRMIQAASVKVGQNVCIAIICILYALPLCSCI